MSIWTPSPISDCPAWVWPVPRSATGEPVRFAQRTISSTSRAVLGAAMARGILTRMRPESMLAARSASLP